MGFLDDIQVFNISLPSNSTKGFVGLGTADYGLADFDNLRIDTAEDGLGRMNKKLKYVQDIMDDVQDTGDSHRSLYYATEHDEKDNKDNFKDTGDSHRSLYYATEHDEKDNKDM